MFKHVPNILTMCRFVLIPFIFGSIVNNQYVAAFVFLTLSGITDILDGFIARKFNLISDFGKLMDPLADKLTQITMLVGFSLKGVIPLWLVGIVLIKEITMITGASFLYGKEMVVSSKWYGKLSTVMLYVAMVSSIIINQWNMNRPDATLPKFDIYIYYMAIGLTIFSLVMYAKTFVKEGYLKGKMKIRQ